MRMSLLCSTKYQSMDGHTMRVFVVKFQPFDSNMFVSGGWDDTLQVIVVKTFFVKPNVLFG